MKALTLWQPWASLVAIGAKTIETRSWSTKYQGPLAIHAAKDERPARTFAAQLLADTAGVPLDMPFGCVVAVATLTEVLPMVADGEGTTPCLEVTPATLSIVRDGGWAEDTDVSSQRPYGDYSPGRFAWLLDHVAPVMEPRPAKGRQGLWEWTP